MNKYTHIVYRILSLILIVVISTSNLLGCAKKEVPVQEYSEETSIDTEAIAEVITNEIKEELAAQTEIEEVSAPPVSISTDWVDYVGDLDTFVYGLLSAEYSSRYDVFKACIDLDDDTTVYGLGFSDYAGVFESDANETYFPAGFLAFIGEPSIPVDSMEEGLVINNLDGDDDYDFVYAYETSPYLEHCIIWDQYLKYGIDEGGRITYESSEYTKGECDEELGALYSFDEQKYVYDPDMGDYQYITGKSLYTDIDYSELEAEVNRILEEQDINFSQVDIDSAIQISQDAVDAFLLGLQKETFMGYDADILREAASNLDPKECIQITPEGMIIIDAVMPSQETPSAVMKWVTGITCGIVVVGCIALDVFCPALAPLSGAIASTAIEVFMEVVISNQTVSNINWAKVGVAAVSGALLAWCCPMLANAASTGIVNAASKGAVTILGKTLTHTALSAIGDLTGYAVLAVSNGIVSGATGAAFTLIDGGSTAEAFEAFKMGALIGGALTIGVSALSAGAGAITKAINNAHPNNWFMRATEKAEKYLHGYTNKEGVFVKGHQIHFSEDIEKVLVPKSIHQATEAAIREVTIQQCGGDVVLADKILQLPSDNNKNFVLKDTDGNIIKKADLAAKKGEGVITLSDNCDPKIAKEWAKKGITEVRITKGDPQFAQFSEYTFKPAKGITPNRTDNMTEYRKELANLWTKNNDLIPSQVKTELQKRNIPLDNFTGNQLEEVFSTLKLTLHEGTDGNVYLMSRIVHSSFGHYGGVALAKALAKIFVATDHLTDLLHTPASSITGTLIAEGVS